MNDLQKIAKEVYSWSSRQTTENSEFNLDEYYWTDTIRRALVRLVNSKFILLAITGLQGSGKSAALVALEKELSTPNQKNCIRYKWRRDWENYFLTCVVPNDHYYRPRLWEHLIAEHSNDIHSKLKADPDTIRYFLQKINRAERDFRIEEDPQKKEKIVNTIDCNWDELDRIADEATLELLLGEKEVNLVRRGLLAKFLAQVQYIFVDLPDYTKNDIRAMNKDIEELQHMWMKLTQKINNKTSIIIAIQKEIFMKRPHFFFGKFSVIEINLLTQQQLIDAYRLKWKTTDPFDLDALFLIASLSRGVFRRFLKYINLTLETMLMNNQEFPVNMTHVENAITFDTISNDMELELADIFTQHTHKLQATKILHLLRGKSLTQKQIAEQLILSESTLSNIVGKLEVYGYVNRKRGAGKSWYVTLA